MVEDNKDLMHEGRLRRVTNNSLEFERKVYNGEFAFQLKRSDIRRLRLRLDMPKEEE
jgi:hypothetical protein